MVFYVGILLIPLFIVVGLVWFFLAGRRSKADETGRANTQARQRPVAETRAQGREA